MRNKHWLSLTLLAVSGWVPGGRAAVNLGSAAGFGVLGDSLVTSTGNTVVNGNLGFSPGPSIMGFGPGVVNGTTYSSGGMVQQAASNAAAAYATLGSAVSGPKLTGQNLGGFTFLPGAGDFSTSAQLTGTLILNGQNHPDEQFIFEIWQRPDDRK